MSLLEAMSSGLPIIASNTGGIPELVTDRENGLLVPPGDAAALSAAMTEMAKSPRLRQTCAAHNTEKVASSYSWVKITSEYLARYYPNVRNDQLEMRGVASGQY
jgi:glycosyltransferase involved in cell wall biosynthesis